MTKRYYLREDGAIFDRKKLRTLTLTEIVNLLNEFEEVEWERFISSKF